MTFNKAVAIRISKLLEEKKMSKYRLVQKSGVTQSALRYMFNEVNDDVRFSTIVKIANALGVSLKEFFDDKVFDYSNFENLE